MKIVLLLLLVTLIYLSVINFNKLDIFKFLNWIIVDI